MTQEKEKTALSPSVGADGGQSDQVINNSISSFDEKIKGQGESAAENLREGEG